MISSQLLFTSKILNKFVKRFVIKYQIWTFFIVIKDYIITIIVEVS